MRLQRRHLVGPIAIAAAIVAILVVWNRTSFVAQEVGRRFTESLLREHGYRLDVRAVRGAPLGDLVLVAPTITSTSDPTRTLVRADAVRVRVRSWRGLLGGRVAIGRLRIERPRIEWPATKAQPNAADAGGPSVTTMRFPFMDVDAIQIVDAQVVTSGSDVPVVDHLDMLLQVRARRDHVTFEIDHGRAVLPRDTLAVEMMQADAVWNGDSLAVSDFQLETAASRLTGSGVLAPRAHRGSAALELDGLDLVELGRVLPQLRYTGQLRGPVQVAWRAPVTRIHGQVAGQVDDWPIPEATVELEQGPRGLHIVQARGIAGGARLDLEADLRGGAVAADVRFADLDLHVLVPERAKPLPAHILNGRATIARAHPADTLHIDLQLHASRVGTIPIQRGAGRLGWQSGTLRVAGGRVETPFGSLRADGVLDAERIDATFDVETQALAAALAAFGQRGPDGDLHLQGRVDGLRRAPQLEADGGFDTWTYRGATARRGTIAIWGHDLARRTIDAEVRTDSLRLAGRQFSDVGTDLALAGSTWRIVRAQASAGDTLVAAAGTVEPSAFDWAGVRRPTTRLRVETLLLRLGARELRVEEPADVWWVGHTVHVDSLRVTTRGGTARVDGTVDTAARTLSVRAAADGVDLGFVSGFVTAQTSVTGQAWGYMTADGSFDATRLQGALHVTNGVWSGLMVDSLGVAIANDGRSVELRDLRVTTPRGTVHGWVRLGVLPPVARLWEERARFRDALAAGRLDGALHLENVDVAHWVARGDRDRMPPWGARVSADVTLGGDFGAPVLAAVGHGDEVHAGAREIGSVDFDLRYADEQLVVRRAEVQNESEKVRITGMVPLWIDFVRGAGLHRDRPLEAQMVLPRSSFALVQRFVPFFEPGLPGMETGHVEAELDVSGTPGSPEVRGGFKVEGASFTLRNMEEVYREVNAEGQFEGSTLVFTSISARTGRDGVVSGSGRVWLEDWRASRYEYRLELRKVPIYSLTDITAVVNGRLRVLSAYVGGAVVPDIRDTLDIVEALITQEFSSGGDSEVFDTDRPEWLSDVMLRATNGNVRLRNSQVEADLSGTLRIVRTPRQLNLIGEVDIKRGRYLDLVNYFRITGGRLDFGAHPGFNPELDIDGETGRPGSRVYVHLTGSALEPRLTFRAEREGVEGAAQIEEEVIGNITSGGAIASTAVASVGGGLLRELEFLRAADFQIDPAGRETTDDPSKTRNEFGVNLSTGFAISDNAYLVYTQGVMSDIQQKAVVELDLQRWPLLLEAGYERRTLTAGGPDQSQNAFDVNLKYRHEY